MGNRTREVNKLAALGATSSQVVAYYDSYESGDDLIEKAKKILAAGISSSKLSAFCSWYTNEFPDEFKKNVPQEPIHLNEDEEEYEPSKPGDVLTTGEVLKKNVPQEPIHLNEDEEEYEPSKPGDVLTTGEVLAGGIVNLESRGKSQEYIATAVAADLQEYPQLVPNQSIAKKIWNLLLGKKVELGGKEYSTGMADREDVLWNIVPGLGIQAGFEPAAALASGVAGGTGAGGALGSGALTGAPVAGEIALVGGTAVTGTALWKSIAAGLGFSSVKSATSTVAGTAGAVAGWDGIMVWMAEDNILTGTAFTLKKLNKAVKAGIRSKSKARTEFNRVKDWMDKAKKVVEVSITYNPFMWPFKDILMANVDKAYYDWELEKEELESM